MDKFDTVQFEKVRDFQEKLKKSGVLFFLYRDSDEFLKIFKQHLGQLMDRWTNTGWEPLSKENQIVPLSAEQSLSDVQASIETSLQRAEPDELPGVLDAMADAMTGVEEALGVARQIGTEMANFNTTIITKTRSITVASKDARTLKALVNSLAEDLSGIAKTVRENRPLLESRFGFSLDSIEQTFKIGREANIITPEQISSFLTSLKETPKGLQGARQQITEFRNVITGIPAFTSKFRGSQSQVRFELDALIATLTLLIDRLDSIIESS